MATVADGSPAVNVGEELSHLALEGSGRPWRPCVLFCMDTPGEATAVTDQVTVREGLSLPMQYRYNLLGQSSIRR